MAEARALRRILVIEDDLALRAGISRLAREWGARVLEAGSVAEAMALLAPPPDLVIADIRLPDGSARSVFEETARAWPRPILVAISGRASAAEAFALGQMGVRAYLPKPLSLADLAAAVLEARTRAPQLEPFVSQAVGRAGLRQVSDGVGRVMLRQALALADGSRSDAARLLDVSRQAVQQRLRGRADPSGRGRPTRGGGTALS